ncbi:hypothetical protein CKM354_000501000 [Cercospora kikuchii]|uniref:tRNA(Ile)-lysidine synthetase n=1 Tax=Cercospora kikuchii TaxID=84275 RepID=A0A9P3FGC2_9PEZI|nr:uncharacterized protein CKM354_000501000 [Cercospora kikuchii]GIZ41714.1 hypothetical protein CKM354_000501000 [Cercospora kikuchii]
MLFSAGHVSAAAKAHAIGNLERHVWNSLEHHFNLAPKGRLGLAVSGGVDSMALASICSSYKKEYRQHNFTGFIVDHGVRPESSDEAFKVAEELQRLGIDPEILKLDWTAHGDPRKLKNFETLARRLRYQALGKACSLQRISTLQVAHHADDLAETVLSRIIAQYLGEGLQGIREITPIPECKGIWGVDGSGARRDLNTTEDGASLSTRNGQLPASKHMLIENGGVYITRPLLSFAKDQLVSVCQKGNVRWFEDSTNADKTLTVRNTIRHLHRSSSLPKALRRESLSDLAHSVHDRHRLFEARAKEIYDNMAIKLDLKTARANFSLPPQYEFGFTVDGEPYHVKALLARKLLSLVSPKQDISLQDLDPAMKVLFETPEASRSDAQLQGTMIVKCPQRTSRKGADNSQFTLSRQNPERDIRAKAMSFSELVLDPSHSKIPWTNFLLWDNRYWVRIGRHHSKPPSSTPSEHLRFSIGFLHHTDIRNLRMSCSNSASRRALDAILYSIGEAKWSQPLITMKIDDGKSSTIEVNQSKTIVGLPTLGWSPAGKARELGIVWDTRYKKIEFGGGDGHVLEAVSGPKDRTQQKSLVQLASKKIEQRAKQKAGLNDRARLPIGKMGRLS